MASPDVICVGAGMAGAHAAHVLADAGLRVLVLEGRGQPGGRTRAVPLAGTALRVEVGGGWVMPDRQPYVRELAARYGLGYVEGPDADRWSWHLGGEVRTGEQPLTSSEWRDVLRAMSRLRAESRDLERARRVGDRSWIIRHDIPLDAWVASCALAPVPRDLLLALIGNAFNSRPGEVSVLNAHLVVSDYGGDPWRGYSGLGFQLAAGTTSLVQHLLATPGVEVRTGADVRVISSERAAVRVETADHTVHRVGAAVVTVPVAAYPRIRIDAAVPPVVAHGNPGRAFKAWFRVRGVAGFPFAVAVDGPIRKLRCEARDGDEALMVAIGNNLPSGELADPLLMTEHLERLVGPVEVLELLAHDWVDDDFSLGGWYAAPPGAVADLLFEPPAPGPVQFAGSDLAIEWNGWIEGALESGAKAAERVLHA